MNRTPTYLALAVLLLSGTSVLAQAPPHMTVEALRGLRLPDVALDSVKAVTADVSKNPHAASYVKVDGAIGGTIRFELLLPETWNGRFVMGGGGGFVGTVQNSAEYSVNLGYATAGTDAGHEWQPGYSAAWAYTNLEAQVNFGYLAVHRTTEVAKAIIRSYYSADIAYSYFSGCSRGGGQALMEAQRFPNDFDGIVSGAPAFNWTGIAALGATISRALYPDPNHLEKTALDKAALQKLRSAIIEQCDDQDGLKDGVIQDPGSVHFDLSKVFGLTDEQRKGIEAIYHGAYNGTELIYPGYTPGSECDPNQWIAWIIGPIPLDRQVHAADLMFAFGTQICKYLIFNNPDWDYSTYDFSNFANDSRLAASFLNATNSSLDGLKARHGKLIIWHGWADPALPPQATINYYRQVQAGDPDAASYCRLFMVPGCLHCGGGPGATEVDWLSAITKWVEHGQSPDRLVASKHEHGELAVTRPIFPYPQIAVYKGSGDASSADNFVAKSPTGNAP